MPISMSYKYAKLKNQLSLALNMQLKNQIKTDGRNMTHRIII